MISPGFQALACALGLGILSGWPGKAVLRAAEPVPVSEEYLLRAWETDDGLPNNGVWGITETPDGYLWIATVGGLARFDGSRFTVFSKNTTPGLESNYVRTVCTTADGELWVGLDRGGVARGRAGRFEVVVPLAPRTAVTSWTSSIAQDRTGAIWFGRAPELVAMRWREGKLDQFNAADGVGPGSDTFVQTEHNGTLWFSTKSACGVFQGEHFQPIDSSGGGHVRLAPARQGGMWAARGDLLLRYQADGSREQIADLNWLKTGAEAAASAAPGELSGPNPAGSPPGKGLRTGAAVEVTVLFEDHAGDLWMGTRSAGLFRFRNGAWVSVPTSSTSVLAVIEDREGNLWVGTRAGLNRLRPTRFALRGARHGFGRDNVGSMCEDSEGKLWVAVQDGLPMRAVDAANQRFAAVAGGPGGGVTVLCADPAGGIWVGTDGTLLQHWENGVLRSENLPKPERIRSLLLDRQNNLWVATARGGLFRRHEGGFERMPTEDRLVTALALAEDAAGAIWAGTEEGLVFRREKDGGFHPVPLPGAKAGESIRFIVAAPDGAVWIGALEGGLYRWRDGKVSRLPAEAGLAMDDLRAMVIDADGDFWIAQGHILVHVARREVEAVLNGQKPTLEVENYGRNEGVPSMEFTFGNRNAALRTRDGHLWFASSSGALEIGPALASKSPPPLPVLIEEVRVNGRAVPLGEAIVLPPHPGPVEIRYTLPSGSAPERLMFRSRCLGLGEDWSSFQEQRVANFSHLPAGDYRWEVEAAMNGKAVGLPAAPLSLRVRAAWWETRWFWALANTTAALALAWIVRRLVLLRVRARMRRLKQETALERERARIARDMHDELGASLTRIALISDLAAAEGEGEGAATERFGEIASAARSVAGTLDQIVWTVNPRNDTLERLVGYLAEFAGEYLESADVALKLELPRETTALLVSSDVRHEVLLAVKEALNNVVKYAGAHCVTLRVSFEHGQLGIVIADDGRGFDPARVAATSNGLTNMQQRLLALGGSTRIESQPGGGTTLTFKLPLSAPDC